MFQRRTSPAKLKFRAIAKPKTIEAMAFPLRQELLDTLEAFGGEASVAELAGQLGRPADGLYYHLRLLAKAGLIREVRGARERRYRIAVPGRGALKIAYRPRDPRNAAALRTLVGGMLRIARRDFERGIADPTAVVDGPHRDLWAGRSKGWVSRAELAELLQLLERTTELLHRPRTAERDRLVTLCHVLAPVCARAKRR